MELLKLLVSFLFLFLVALASAAPTVESVEMVVALIRHGIRAPYANDFKFAQDWPTYEYEELTPAGQQQ